MSEIQLIECPRDAMQGLPEFISTEAKVRYINQLLKVGFEMIDFGSFVSPKSIPQMKDTHDVVSQLDKEDSTTKLSAIVANYRGASEASEYEVIDFLGFPFSISEVFQQRNTKKGQEEAIELVEQLLILCETTGKELLVYASMAFGNPYDELYDPALLTHWIDRLEHLGVKHISLADTIGVATPKLIKTVFDEVIEDFPKLEISAHFHTTPDTWQEKIDAAYEAGCRKFEGALKGYGGCPMAKDELVGNMPTEKMIAYFLEKEQELGLEENELAESMKVAGTIFE